MRAMILAAGLGTRMQPLSALRPKPILPVRGVPLLAYPLAWLAHHGVREVIVNLHHFPDATRAVAEVWAPPGARRWCGYSCNPQGSISEFCRSGGSSGCCVISGFASAPRSVSNFAQ